MEPEGKSAKQKIPQCNFSPMYEKYYHDLLVPSVMSEEENKLMFDTYKSALPIVFRITKDVPHYDDLCKEAEKYFDDLRGKGYKCERKTSLPPEFGAVFQLEMPETVFRRDESVAGFKQWLRNNTSLGYIRRQELVSMIPHHFLNAQPDDFILDMCASPGSKTCQILESVTGESGLVIANDNDLKRCYKLLHQVQEIGTSKVLVTCNEAQYFPDFGKKYDRILADVPCSGDGTVRKDANAGSRWKPNNSQAMHGLQRNILKRGLELLKVDGTLVYSTCSMNPIEDEAVISSVVQEIGEDFVEIADVSSMFPQLKRTNGFSTWPVYTVDKENPTEMIYFENYESVPQKLRAQAPKTMFPSGVKNLERCMRFFPHYENSGGFFVTVLRKKKDFTLETKMKEQKKINEAPFITLNEQFPDFLKEIIDLYGLKNFPTNQLFARNETNAKNVYFLCKPCADLVNTLGYEKMNAVSGGVPIFTKKDNTIYPSALGASFIIEHATRQVIQVSPQEIQQLLESGEKGVATQSLSEETQKQIKNSIQGGALIYLPGTRFVYGGMIFKASIALYVRKDLRTNEIAKFNIAYPELAKSDEKADEESTKQDAE